MSGSLPCCLFAVLRHHTADSTSLFTIAISPDLILEINVLYSFNRQLCLCCELPYKTIVRTSACWFHPALGTACAFLCGPLPGLSSFRLLLLCSAGVCPELSQLCPEPGLPGHTAALLLVSELLVFSQMPFLCHTISSRKGGTVSAPLGYNIPAMLEFRYLNECVS